MGSVLVSDSSVRKPWCRRWIRGGQSSCQEAQRPVFSSRRR